MSEPGERDEMLGTLVLSRYRVVRPLARGGMGVVYLARTEGAAGFARPVVIKRIIPDLTGDDNSVKLFVREARILSNLQHPGIVNVVDFGEEGGAYVMVLEYVHGYHLGEWHRYVVSARERMPADHAIHIMTRVLDAIHYAHTFTRADGKSMQIIHRDVSPGNILLDAQGHVKLLDFGIARIDEAGEYKTRDGTFKGKLAFTAPEIYHGAEANVASDVYSCAVVLYQLLAGENPFRGKEMSDTVRRVLTHSPPYLAAMRDDVPDEMDEILQKALSKKPEDRFSSAAAFADALRATRERPENETVTELAERIREDFTGEMADVLKLEPLAVRDAAWREAVDDEIEVKELSSTLPPSRGILGDELPTLTDQVKDPSWLDGKTTAPPDKRSSSRPASRRPPPKMSKGMYAMVGVAVLAAVAALVVSVVGRDQTPAGPSRYIMVEGQGQNPEPGSEQGATATPTAEPTAVAATAEPTATEEPAVDPTADPPPGSGVAPTSGGSKRGAGTAKSGPDPGALTRTFSKKQNRIESCFSKHAKQLQGRPHISVRFSVNSSGGVDSAQLAPGSLASTPLGQCILSVARSTQFGPQTASVSFAIPITARKL